MDAKEWWSEREADRASAPVDAYLGTRSNYKREADVANDGDRTLLTAIAAGDKTALREIHSRYYRRVASFSWRITGRYDLAEEVTNDTLLVIWQSAARFKAASKSLDL